MILTKRVEISTAKICELVGINFEKVDRVGFAYDGGSQGDDKNGKIVIIFEEITKDVGPVL